MRKYLIIIIVIASLCGMLKCSQNKLKRQKEEIERLEANQKALISDVDYYKTKSSEKVASVQALTLTKKELEENFVKITDQLRNLKIETKRLKSVSETAIQSEHKIKAKLEQIIRENKDSLLQPPDTLHCINFDTPYASIKGCVDKTGTFEGEITTTDTLLQVVHIIPKRFLFIKYGVKGLRQDIKMANPNAAVAYTKYIQLK